ncbi:MAG: TolC family protein, partial [Verrucomicrobiota bacterium]
IAVLLGRAPSRFSIRRERLDFRLPKIHSGVPMEILQHRPDIAAAVSSLDSANAAVGVAKREFLPRFELISSGGLSSLNSSDFFDWSSRTFALGPEITVPVFQGGRLRSNLERNRAIQAEALATYQDTVLIAMREVEDALVDIEALEAERNAQSLAVRASTRALSLSNKRYEEGLVSSIEVIDAVREQLDAQRRAVQIRSLQYDATVRLIQALGGGLSDDFAK